MNNMKRGIARALFRLSGARMMYLPSVFASGQVNRLTASQPTMSQAMDWDLFRSLRIMRARARSLSVNNDFGRKFLQMCATHIVGPHGFRLQVRVYEPAMNGNNKFDGLASAAIEKAFFDWAKRGNCDVTGMHSFYDACNLIVKAVARDGEALVRKVYGQGKYGFQLQIFDIDRLDINYNKDLGNGALIKMGVEINKYGKPVAFHIRSQHPGDTPYYTYEGAHFERVLAEDVYHLFIPERPEQNRGIPWMVSAMLRMENLGGYEDAAILAARVGASKMGFYTTPDGDGSGLTDVAGLSDTTNSGRNEDLLTEADPGQFEVLPRGVEFQTFNPDYPHQQFGDFVKAALRGISSGLGVAYNTLSNDLEGVNFSSIRTGVLEERDNWMMIQKWLIENFLNDVFSTWLKYALLSRAVTMPNGSPLPVSKFDKFNVGKWQGRRWQWVDPLKDAEASVLLINNGLRDRSDVITEGGRDPDHVFQTLADEQKKIKELGLNVATPADKAAPQQPASSTEPPPEDSSKAA